jgi:hypothetical protein
MATVFEACTTEDQRFGVRFVWENGRNVKDIHK